MGNWCQFNTDVVSVNTWLFQCGNVLTRSGACFPQLKQSFSNIEDVKEKPESCTAPSAGSGCYSDFNNSDVFQYVSCPEYLAASESLGTVSKHRLLNSFFLPTFMPSGVWFSGSGGQPQNAFLTNFCMLLKLPVWGPHFENQCTRLNQLGKL